MPSALSPTIAPRAQSVSSKLKRPLPDVNAHYDYDEVITKIADYVYDYTIDSPKAWVNAKAALLDALGCAYESLDVSTACAQLIGPVYPSTAIVTNGFRLPGTQYQLDILKGTFDMGVMIRYLDHNDAFLGAEWGHPSGMSRSLLQIVHSQPFQIILEVFSRSPTS